MCLSEGRGTSSDPSKSDQEKYLCSILLHFDGSGSPWGEVPSVSCVILKHTFGIGVQTN